MLANNKKKIKLKLKSNNNKINYKNTKEKGDIYEIYIYYHLLETNKYKNAIYLNLVLWIIGIMLD